MSPHKTWEQKMAEVRAKRRARAKQPSASGAIVNDFFDVFGQLVGGTDEWTGASKYRKRKR